MIGFARYSYETNINTFLRPFAQQKQKIVLSLRMMLESFNIEIQSTLVMLVHNLLIYLAIIPQWVCSHHVTHNDCNMTN